MPYVPNLGGGSANNTPDPVVSISTQEGVKTVITPENVNTTVDGKATLRLSALLVVLAIALLWGAALGLKV